MISAVAHLTRLARAGFVLAREGGLAFVDASWRGNTPLVLAVSGGCDSMVLMHAVARACEWSAGALRDVPARVLTFDHGTGPAASAAAAASAVCLAISASVNT